jgi:hypothetical protein
MLRRMSVWVAVPCSVASAALYGLATAMQHLAAHNEGRADARQLIRLLINPRWLRSILVAVLALVLQAIALASGSVVLVQPLLVLALPLSLPVNRLLGGPPPRRSDYVACVTILLALTGFFAVAGSPGDGAPSTGPAIVWTVVIAVVASLALCAVVTGRGIPLRAGVYGAVSGGLLGIAGVMIAELSKPGVGSGAGRAALLGLLVVGGLGAVLVQVSFQVGSLGASYSANQAATPLIAVLLGTTLLHEHVRSSAPALLAYLVALVAIVFGAVRLANPAQYGTMTGDDARQSRQVAP